MKHPSFRVIERALRATTERLSGELVQPLPQAPQWSELEWDVARAVAAMQGISALLKRTLLWTGPQRWELFLHEQHTQGLRRDRRVDKLLQQIDGATRGENVAVMALKGAALRPLRLYEPGDRPMADIDLLARSADFASATRALQRIGFVEAFRTPRHVVFSDRAPCLPHGLGEHIDNALRIELHDHISNELPASAVDITARLWPREPRPGLNFYPDTAALLAHLLLHAAANMRAHALRLLQLQDIVRLLPCMTSSDWAQLLHGQRERPWWALPPLVLAQRFCGAEVPEHILASLSEACPATLVRAAQRYTLTSVSWSNLRVAAFPGIEWSRSPLEALRFVKSRVLPRREALDLLPVALRAQPQIATLPWYALSHRARILRWVFTRPPRVQTMASVRAALAHDGEYRAG